MNEPISRLLHDAVPRFRASVYRIRYSDRRKFTRSCWFFELRLLKLVTL